MLLEKFYYDNFYFVLQDSPFPLYPGETLQGAPNFLNLKNDPDISKAIKPLPVILANHAIRLVANNDFEDAFGKHQAGEMWQLEGPLTYRPQPEAVCTCLSVKSLFFVGAYMFLDSQNFAGSLIRT